jgi:hypothetical protein
MGEANAEFVHEWVNLKKAQIAEEDELHKVRAAQQELEPTVREFQRRMQKFVSMSDDELRRMAYRAKGLPEDQT